MRRHRLKVLLLLPLVLAAFPSQAQDRTRAYGKATAPYWQVGNLRKDLTALCRRGQFNQVKKDRLYIGYVGKEAGRRTLTGIAKKDFNLFDPTGKAEDKTTYHFLDDGYSTCQVYEAKERDPGTLPPPR